MKQPASSPRLTLKKIKPLLRYAGIIILAFIIALAYLSSQHHDDHQYETVMQRLQSEPDLNRRPVSDTTFFSFDRADQLELSSLQGQVVLLAFWASWCAPCRTEIPLLDELAHQYGKKSLRVLLINVDDKLPQQFIDELWAERELKLNTYFDHEKSLMKKFSVDVLPTNIVLDKTGKLVWTAHGSIPWDIPEARAFLDALLEETPEDSGTH